MHRILIADSLPEEALAAFQDMDDIEIDNRPGISPDDLASVLSGYEGLVVRSRTRVTAELLGHGETLRVIGRAGAGVDNIDSAEATRRGIIVMNTPGGNTIAAAEHTLALILSTLRNVPQAHGSMKAKRWDRKTYMGNELYQKTVGIIGLGKIGQEVARRLAAFDTHLVGYDPLLSREIADRLGIRLASLDELLAASDIITVHAPRMAETIDMINAETLSRCKDGVVLINCARGGLMNEADVLAALESGKVGAAAFDVFTSEPPEEWALVEHPRVVATPHLGASTEEAQSKVAVQVLEQMITYFRRGVAMHAVNFLSVDEAIQPVIAPYFEMGRALGTLFSRLAGGRLQQVALRFYGDVTELPLEPIASHLMAGALRSGDADGGAPTVEMINMVNALTIAREKGIALELTRKDHPLHNQTNLIACDFHTETGLIHLAGSVYAPGNYRLVEFGKYVVDADLTGRMVIVENDDVPGIIGKVGTALGAAGINIGGVSSGRDREAGTAINIFNVEGDLEASLATELAADGRIRSVRLV